MAGVLQSATPTTYARLMLRKRREWQEGLCTLVAGELKPELLLLAGVPDLKGWDHVRLQAAAASGELAGKLEQWYADGVPCIG